MKAMATVHMTEAELARDLHEVLAKVRQGTEVVIEQDQRPIAILKPSPSMGRLPSEILADLKARGSNATMDDDFANDIQKAIDAQRKPWNPPSWE
jgi:antitoxin (DNA-binding transcriptional repressor) of toxin-antitoxin stability system